MADGSGRAGPVRDRWSALGRRPLLLRFVVLVVIGGLGAGTALWVLRSTGLDAAVQSGLEASQSLGAELVDQGIAERALNGGEVDEPLELVVAAGVFESVSLLGVDAGPLAEAGASGISSSTLELDAVIESQRARAEVDERSAGDVVLTVVPLLRTEAGDGVVLQTTIALGEVGAIDRRSVVVAMVTVLIAALLALVPLAFVERHRDRRLREQSGTLAGMLAREARTFGEANDLQRLKADFLTGVSHGLRTTLHVITGSAQTLSRRGEQLRPAQRLALANRIAAQAQRFDSLVRDLLEVEELAEGRPSTHRTDVLVSDVLHSVRFATNLEGRELASDVTGVSARMSPAHLERVLLHLVRNAVHHTPKGSRIVVVARRLADGAELIVEDDGPGIPVAERLQVFDPLSRGRGGHADPDPGLGLGLAVVRRVTHLYGGRAWIDDSPMGGAAVHVWIPDAAGTVGVDPFNLPATLDVGERQEPNQSS